MMEKIFLDIHTQTSFHEWNENENKIIDDELHEGIYFIRIFQ